MKMRLNLLAVAVVVAGAADLARPAAAGATYLSPLDRPPDAPAGSAVVFCCYTGNTARCCFEHGCWSKDGFCVRIP